MTRYQFKLTKNYQVTGVVEVEGETFDKAFDKLEHDCWSGQYDPYLKSIIEQSGLIEDDVEIGELLATDENDVKLDDRAFSL